jgi:hypothetical protein
LENWNCFTPLRFVPQLPDLHTKDDTSYAEMCSSRVSNRVSFDSTSSRA